MSRCNSRSPEGVLCRLEEGHDGLHQNKKSWSDPIKAEEAMIPQPDKDEEVAMARRVWTELLRAIYGVSPFTWSYFTMGEPVSFDGQTFIIGFRPESHEAVWMVDNTKNKTLIESRLEQMGYGAVQVEIIELCPQAQPKQEVTAQAKDEVGEVIAERGKVYGDPLESMGNIGLSWTALLQQHYGIKLPHPVPADVVARMLVCFKMQRASKAFHRDNYVDGHAYMRFAEEAQGGMEKP